MNYDIISMELASKLLFLAENVLSANCSLIFPSHIYVRMDHFDQNYGPFEFTEMVGWVNKCGRVFFYFEMVNSEEA